VSRVQFLLFTAISECRCSPVDTKARLWAERPRNCF